jgi:hypothetical protein
MFDCRDQAFANTSHESELGPPVLTPRGIIFLSERRFAFDEYNVEFKNTGVMPRLAPPIRLADGSVRCFRAP